LQKVRDHDPTRTAALRAPAIRLSITLRDRLERAQTHQAATGGPQGRVPGLPLGALEHQDATDIDALVERYAPLVWSICRSHRVGDADAADVGRSVWLQLVDQLDGIRDPTALPGWLASVTRQECLRVLGAARAPLAAGHVVDAETVPAEQAGPAEQELLVAELYAALREAFRDLPECDQRLILVLIEDPPVPYAEISARLGIPTESIRLTRARCLDKLRRHPAIAALINAEGGEV
jgi:RNA polymerase sigma factor (sigma-70 family)